MKILDKAVYVGPSLYAHFPVIKLDIDLGPLEDWPSGKLGPRFTDPLLAALPGLKDHGCSYGKPGGFVRRLTEGEGTWMGHILEHMALELQNVAGESVTFGKTRSQGPRGHYYVVYQYEQEEVGMEAGLLALTLLHSLLPPELQPDGAPSLVGSGQAVPPDFDFAAERDDFIRFAQRRALGPSTMALIRAAEERRIPWIRMNEQNLIQFGHGRYQQRIQATVTSRTPHIAVELASDKEETNRILGNLGLPVPRQRLVQTADDAATAAEKIGYPVVVKPYNANHGRGITVHLTTPEQVRTAFDVAREHSRSVIIESFITGEDHRMLVINGELVAVAKRVPGHVVGDGVHTIEQLVERVNQDPRRGVGHEKVLTRLVFDNQAEVMLARKGYTRESIPPVGEQVFLRSTGNLSTGGTATDLTDLVHPDNIEMAVRAVKAIGLDVGGVDFLSTDITESYKEIGGAICEVNAAPGFRMHMAPSEGRPRDVGGAVMDMLFTPGTPSRIPIAAVTGTNGKTTTARMLAHIQKLAGHHVGLTSTDGVYIDGQRTVPGDMTGPLATRMVLSDPSVDVAVLEIARGGLLRSGMGIRHCDVGAVLNVKADHLGLRGIGTLAQLAEVKRIVVEVARDTAILNADDPLCLKMADYTQAKHLCYVTMNPAHELVREHIQEGGRAMVLESGMKGQMITLYDHGAHIPLLWTHLIPATMEGRAMHNVQNAMFAAAMAFSMGLKLEDIRHGLRTFDTTFFQAPGRMNIYDEHPFKVILDYGHNPAAVEAMCELVERLDVGGRRLCVLSAPGDRRDQDIAEIGRIAAGRFDRYICRRDDQLRGRKPDEVSQLLRDSLLANGVPAEQILVIPEEPAAVDTALREARSGDLLLIFADAITRTWKQVIQFRPDAASAPIERSRSSRPELAIPVAANGGEDHRREFVRDSRGVRVPRQEELED
jgi:cyanophycin synthetase